VSGYAATPTDMPDVIYRPEKHGVEHVVVSDSQTLASRLGLYRVILDDPKLLPMPRGCAQGGVHN